MNRKPILLTSIKLMKTSKYLFLLILFLLPLQIATAQTDGENTSIDQIVAVVNDHTILESDVDRQVRRVLYQQQRNGSPVSFNEDMWYRVLNNMVESLVLFEQAKIDSVTVTADQVDQRIERRIQQIVRQVGSREALEEQLGKSLLQVKADLREQYRQDIIIRKYRRQKLTSIEITRPEVVEFFKQIPADSLPEVPEQVAVSQIVAIPSPNEQAQEEAYQLAKALRDSILNYGKSFEALARKYSEGPAASRGGKLSLMPIDDLVPPYAAAAAVLEPGEISKVVKTDFGYHIIRLDKRRGDMIATHNILITIDETSYNEQEAIQKLKAIRDTVISNPEVTFAEMARKKSEDPNTANQGGQILQPQTGNRLLSLQQLNPALYRIVLLLEEGEISEPKPFNVTTAGNTQPAYRIVRLDEQISGHTASLESDYQLIKKLALREKKFNVMRRWVSRLKENIYIDYKIPVPSYLKETITANMSGNR